MTATFDLDRELAAWLQEAGPAAPSPASVADAIATARTLEQRRGLWGRLAGARPWPAAPGRLPDGVLAMVVVVLLLVALAGIVAVAAGLPERLSTNPPLTIEPDGARPLDGMLEEPTTRLEPVPEALRGRWVTGTEHVRPFGAPEPQSMTLILEERRATVTVPGWPEALVASSAAWDPASDELVLVSETTASGSPGTLDGRELAPCAKGDASAYRVEVSTDTGVLVLRAYREGCRARSAILNAGWWRSLAADNAGGPGVLDTLARSFFADLPAGGYRSTASEGMVRVIGDNGVTLSVWQDPLAFTDGCDTGAGPVAPGGAAAFVDLLRGTHGLDIAVDVPERPLLDMSTVTDLARVRLRAEPDACGVGRGAGPVAAWVPGAGRGSPDAIALVEPGAEREVVVFDLQAQNGGQRAGSYVIEVVAPDEATKWAVLDSITPVADLSPYASPGRSDRP